MRKNLFIEWGDCYQLTGINLTRARQLVFNLMIIRSISRTFRQLQKSVCSTSVDWLLLLLVFVVYNGAKISHLLRVSVWIWTDYGKLKGPLHRQIHDRGHVYGRIETRGDDWLWLRFVTFCVVTIQRQLGAHLSCYSHSRTIETREKDFTDVGLFSVCWARAFASVCLTQKIKPPKKSIRSFGRSLKYPVPFAWICCWPQFLYDCA